MEVENGTPQHYQSLASFPHFHSLARARLNRRYTFEQRGKVYFIGVGVGLVLVQPFLVKQKGG